MLSGHFKNCYGIKEFDMTPGIDFSKSNKALIYAPNGVMKTSFTKVFEDLSKGLPSKDRIFSDTDTSYSITYNGREYAFTSTKANSVPTCDKVYVVNSFTNNFEFTRDTLSTLLADEKTRNEYNELMAEFIDEVKLLETELAAKSGLTKPKVKKTLISDLGLSNTSDWPDIVNELYPIVYSQDYPDYLSNIKHTVLFSEKAVKEYEKPEFKKYIKQYIERLDELLQNSELLTTRFTDRSAESLTKSFSSNNMFLAKHKVVLRDGTEIKSLDDWKHIVDVQIQRMYEDEALHSAFEKLKKNLTANNDVNAARQVIIEYREIIPLLFDISSTKKKVWASYCMHLEKPFELYHTAIKGFTNRVRNLYEKAALQSERWQQVVSEFNRRFRVPFTVKINNKSNFILKDEAPNLSFIYKRGKGEYEESTDLTKDALLPSLSMGEKRAMYLLYILFELERIREEASAGKKHLVIADDIADSFDYKNKYAIIEYLADLSRNTGIDLLILTHNFDFYRTVLSRIKVDRPNCFIAQKDNTGKIKMDVFPYQRDFFNNVIISGIRGRDVERQKRMLLASVPFYRNLAEYSGDNDKYLELTCFLHYKTTPIDTSSATLADLWEIIKPYVNGASTQYPSNGFFETVQQCADIILTDTDDISLVNKLILSIAARLQAEKYLKQIIISNEGQCPDSTKDQFRDWSEKAKQYIGEKEKTLMDEINLITPESIHLNAFMYEPLIDISSWALKDIYERSAILGKSE